MNKKGILTVIIVMATFVATSFAQSGEEATTEAEPEGEPTSSPQKDAGVYGARASILLICFGSTMAILWLGFKNNP